MDADCSLYVREIIRFMHCSAESKKRMAAGEEPDCLIDAWIKAMIEAKSANETSANGEKALLNREYSDHEIGMVLLSFLFASQGESLQRLVMEEEAVYSVAQRGIS